jgi:hypothetical protein
MKLLTEISLPDYPIQIDHRAPSLFLGSCFTDNIGRLLQRSLFPVSINPFGVTYNPVSVMKQLFALMEKEHYKPGDLNQHGDLWFSFDHYTGFSSPDREICLEGINKTFLESKKVLSQAKLLVITWGTAWVYSYKTTGEVVCNCHKIPTNEFTRSRLSVKEIIGFYSELLPKLFQHNPNLKVLFTVSPVRHWKDGAHGNQLSKASLLLATEALEQQFPEQVFYFPSYELLMDELRDYRFYGEDLLHPNNSATRYIWEKFQKVLVSEESQQIVSEMEPLLKMEEHRPSEIASETHQKTLKKRDGKRAILKNKYPFLNWQS